jgi:ParB-like chromosome segregation protein Spo0J
MTVDPPTEEQYQAIKASIASIGLVNPEITVLEGQCLDGNTRLRACLELGLTHLLTIKEFDPATDGDPYEYVRAQNEHRRHLSDEQRSQIAGHAVALRQEGLTYGRIAERLGSSERTVRRLIRNFERAGALSEGAGQEPADPPRIVK